MIALIDYGAGNLFSVERALKAVKAQYFLTSQPKNLVKADKLLLPGVGAFADGMEGLKKRNLITAIQQGAKTKPILGICLGMQLLMEEGNEFGLHKGLGLIKGKVNRIKTTEKLPQIGWNQIRKQKQSQLLKGINDKEFFYFVHSFVVRPEKLESAAAKTDYGGDVFCSVIEAGHIYGTQFHPEKSAVEGLKIYRNFCNLNS